MDAGIELVIGRGVRDRIENTPRMVEGIMTDRQVDIADMDHRHPLQRGIQCNKAACNNTQQRPARARLRFSHGAARGESRSGVAAASRQ
jgi:hypothetical protein